MIRIVAAAVGCFLLVGLPTRSAAQPGEAAGVSTAEVLQRSVMAEATYVANVFPHRRAVIGSAVDGRVEDYPVDAGQAVSAGDTLALIRTATINIELAAAEAEKELRAAELAELQNGSLDEEIALAEAQMAAAEAAAKYTLSRFQRAEKLFRDSAGLSQEEFEAARSESLRAAATLEQARNQLKLVRDGPRPEKIAQAKARLEMQKQVVAGIDDRIKKYTLRAPFDGFVSREHTEVGAWVSQGDAVAEVIEIDPLEVVVNVPEASIPFVSMGESCTVRIEALPGRVVEGQIAAIVPEGDVRARSFPVRIRVPNPQREGQPRLLPGMMARVALPVGETELALLVPKDALNLAGDAATLIKVVGGKAAPVKVRKGASFGGLIQVFPAVPASLAAGDAVVVRGNERLRPGQAVAVRSTLDSAALFDGP
ncbi:efflux RND transporter periplasmic adaptor subunit [Roseimaritima ulvae]|uniref:Efflux pump periplasmic linker BepF n=1 Tax=Roseimaritima ulvae TaxID=980254 RepID=A0A5B9R2P2_9BACT|nr:efflux RND transporter periplasmic adaptor subunit [Roseimaritima ulvae]QEG43696.1 Efflux pump periplasmic linker BepF [Roseimaritima ulvae]